GAFLRSTSPPSSANARRIRYVVQHVHSAHCPSRMHLFPLRSVCRGAGYSRFNGTHFGGSERRGARGVGWRRVVDFSRAERRSCGWVRRAGDGSRVSIIDWPRVPTGEARVGGRLRHGGPLGRASALTGPRRSRSSSRSVCPCAGDSRLNGTHFGGLERIGATESQVGAVLSQVVLGVVGRLPEVCAVVPVIAGRTARTSERSGADATGARGWLLG
ncbi:MAG: hypothetical protein QOI35_3359, partial [Cryptosporangiaceae bacterium]|nr:hypothetical protein [Cryptosporangiaceae bacterium]